MIRTIHQWLLVILYRFTIRLCHRIITWQKLLRNALLPYAVKHYQSGCPDTAKPGTAKPVKHWQERLKEAQEAGNPISIVNHRRPLPDDCYCPECGAPLDGETPVSLLKSQNVIQNWQKLMKEALKAA